MTKQIGISAWLTFATLLLSQSARCAESAPARTELTIVPAEQNEAIVDHASVSYLSFLVGRWQSESPTEIVEQIWSAPLGSGMVGIFRRIEKEKTETREYQFQTIENTTRSPFMTVRRFTKGPNDSGESSMLGLDSYNKNNAVFKGEDSTVIYIKVNDDLVKVETQKNAPDGTLGVVSTIELRRKPN